jgi:alginate production protein
MGDPGMHCSILPPRVPGLRTLSCLAFALCLGTTAAAADEEIEHSFKSGYERLSSSFHPLGHDFWIMGKLKFSLDAELDFDLGGEANHQDEVKAEPEGMVALAWQPRDWFRVVTRAELKRKFVLAPSDKDHGDARLSLTRGYVVAENLLPGVTVVAGRQNFVDKRKWIWEEPLDGARVTWLRGTLAFDVAAARDELMKRNLLDRRDPEGGNYFWASGRYAFTDSVEAGLYALYAGNRENRDDDLLFLGLQSYGKFIEDVEHWLEVGVVTGEERDRDVLGFGFDVGATWQSSLPLKPYFTLAAAFGSGDNGKGTDNAFRQTGLQENSAKFGGVTSFDYYGQVLDPELSNLLILTAGVGVRPSRRSSVDLVYHHYRQIEKSDKLRDAALDADPNGASTYLGDGLDLVLGWRATDGLSLKVAGGVFLPGPAFDADEPAYQISAEAIVRF